MALRHLRGSILALGLALWITLPTGTTIAATAVEFGTPTAEASFGVGIDFSQPIRTTATVDRVELLLTFPSSIGPLVIEDPAPVGTGSATLRHRFDVGADGHLPPNTVVEARWRVRTEDGTTTVGPNVSIRYEDDRFDWRTISGPIMSVHWYEGPDAFAQRALRIGEEAVAEAEALLGVTEDEPIDFFIYADTASFYDALGPGTRENVGGQANSDIRTLFALIGPAEIDDPWVSIVIPHELDHLVLDTAVDNPYHFPPRWLNEGLAVYLSQGYTADDRAQVAGAARAGSLIPLDGLTGQFPTTREGFYLAYAESVSAVDHLVAQHGEDALVALIRSYADGVTDDEAFEAALGTDVAGFNEAWFASLGADVPDPAGPAPAPPGPLPEGWTADGAPDGQASTPAPGTPVEPAPGVSDGGLERLAVPLVLGLLVGAGLGLVVVGVRSRRRAGPVAPVTDDAAMAEPVGAEPVPPDAVTPEPSPSSDAPDP